ncbi:uncharacterized protein [Patagioenas fasciata]|uniref:uncharacterized protein isoform X2 n=1 Tax=Patagioenas fasciata TaxID=372321 RepID=UPI003A992029
MASVGPGSGGRGRAEDVAVRSQPGGCRWLRPPRAGEARLAAWRRRDGGCCCWSQRGWGEEKRKKCGAVGPTSASCGGLRTAERPELLERKGGEKETGASELLEASWQPPKARAARWICDLAESPGCCTELVGSRSCGGGASTSQSCGRRTGRTRCPGAASGRAEVTCGGNEQEPRGAGAAVGRAVPGERKSMAPLSCGSISVLFRGVFNLGCSVDPFCSRWPTIAWKQQKLFAPAERIERTSRWRMLKTPGSLMEAALHKARGLKGATYGAPSFATRTPNHRDNVAVQLLRTVCVSAF